MSHKLNGDRRDIVPEIVHIVIVAVARMRHGGEMPPETCEEKLRRLEREELDPRGLALLVRELPDGRTRFLIKAMNGGTVHDMVEYPPADGCDGDGAGEQANTSLENTFVSAS